MFSVFIEFNWRWILLQIVCTAAVWLFADRRGRSAMQRYSDELRVAARELSMQSEQLTSVKEAAKESRQESRRRAEETKAFHDRVKQLNDLVTILTEERDVARGETADLQAKVEDLTTRLARSDVRRALLEKEVSAASLKRLELLSQLKNDERRRLTALTSLRQPGVKMGLGVVAGTLPGVKRLSVGALSPSPVAKSPSESFLINLQPDLEPDSSDDDINLRELESTRKELKSRMKKKLEKGVPVVNLGKAATETVEDDKTDLERNEDSVQPMMTLADKSIAAAAQDNTTDATELVVRAEVPRENNDPTILDATGEVSNTGSRESKSSDQPIDKVESSDGVVKVRHEGTVGDVGNRGESRPLGATVKLSEGVSLGERGSRGGIASSAKTTNPATGMKVRDGGNCKGAMSESKAVKPGEERGVRNDVIQEGAMLPEGAARIAEDMESEDGKISCRSLPPNDAVGPGFETNVGDRENARDAAPTGGAAGSIQHTKLGEIRNEGLSLNEAAEAVQNWNSANGRKEEDAVATDEVTKRGEDMSAEDRNKTGEAPLFSEAAGLAESMEETKSANGVDSKNSENLEKVVRRDGMCVPASDTYNNCEESHEEVLALREVLEPAADMDTESWENRDGAAEQNEVFEPAGNILTRYRENHNGTATSLKVSEPGVNVDNANPGNREDAAARVLIPESTEDVISGDTENAEEAAALDKVIKSFGDTGAREWKMRKESELPEEATEREGEEEISEEDENAKTGGSRDDDSAIKGGIMPSERTNSVDDTVGANSMAASSTQKVGAKAYLSRADANAEQLQNSKGKGAVIISDNNQLADCTTIEHGWNEVEATRTKKDNSAGEKVSNTLDEGSLRDAESREANQDQLSINRTPWIDTLNPGLQRRSNSWSLQEATRLDSPYIPGIISSTTRSSQ